MEENINLSASLLAARKNRWREIRRVQLGLPKYTLGEEIANAITHGVGVLFAIISLIILLCFTPRTILVTVSVSIYGGTMFLLYTVSSLYHALSVTKAKKVFQILDHCTIFLLIAGTYTPISFLCLGGILGNIVFSIIWVFAILGIVLNAVDMERFKKFSMICYLGMGWFVILSIKTLWESMAPISLGALLIGGIFYTIGAVIYGKGSKMRYMHTLWHVFVLAGSIFHFLAIYQLAIVV